MRTNNMYRNKNKLVLLPVQDTPFIHTLQVWQHGLSKRVTQPCTRQAYKYHTCHKPYLSLSHIFLQSVLSSQLSETVLIIILPVNISFIQILKTEACSDIWKESMSVERRSVTKDHKYHSQVQVKEKWVKLKKKITFTMTVIQPLALHGLEETVHFLCVLFVGKSLSTQMWPQPR